MKYIKHIHVLNLLAQIPCYRGRTITNKDRDDAVAAWDHLFYYIHQNWAAPLTQSHRVATDGEKAEVVDCRELLNMAPEELSAKLMTLPPYFTEAVFPVAIGRYMLRELAMPFRVNQSTTFLEFHRRYGTMILTF